MARASTLHVPSFSGGVVRLGSTDAQQVTELAACEKFDIGDRGQLVLASGTSAWHTPQAIDGTAITAVRGISSSASQYGNYIAAVVEGHNGAFAADYLLAGISPNISEPPSASSAAFNAVPASNGALVTFAAIPFVKGTTQLWPLFVNIGARALDAANLGPGLYVYLPSTGISGALKRIDRYDALGTGPEATDGTVGTKAKTLPFRGIAAYNAHLFGWGVDRSATNTDGPNRLMFSNLGNPFKWGNDNKAASGDRDFTDSDAILIGGAGEAIRACYEWNGRLWVATNRQLHYLAGYGRESFLTDGVRGVHKSESCVGPHGMTEGPDGLLYGLSPNGLWAYDGSGAITPLYRKLRDYAGRSVGWFDCLWTDTTHLGTPAYSNLDTAWLLSVPEAQQVWCVIPYCDATAGYGFGSDTVIIKYHVQTGGFTKQSFPGKLYLHGHVFRQETTALGGLFLVEQSSPTVERYAYRATAAAAPPLPSVTPPAAVTTIPYAPFGPDGVGICRKVALTLAWESAAALPLHLALGATVDDETVTSCRLSIATTSPTALGLTSVVGDLWLDTSGTDTALGVGGAGVLIPASQDYVLRRYRGGAWQKVYGAGGQKGTRATVPIAFPPKRGTRVQVSVALDATVAVPAAGRFQLEGLGLAPALVQSSIT